MNKRLLLKRITLFLFLLVPQSCATMGQTGNNYLYHDPEPHCDPAFLGGYWQTGCD